MGDPIAFVVRDVTGETQLSKRFVLRSHARDFAEKCAMPVRVWRVVRKAPSAGLTDRAREVLGEKEG